MESHWHVAAGRRVASGTWDDPPPAIATRDTPCDLAELSRRMRPSEYTTAALRMIQQRACGRRMDQAIDIGTGSGVLLAALARQGARELWAVDIDPDSLLVAADLLGREVPGQPLHLLLSDVWRDVPARKFDVIVANLPHFPADLPPAEDRNPHWSGGGRVVLDAFLDGIAAHLAPDGVAWMTHHALAGLTETEEILRAHDLTMEAVFSWTVYESAARISAVPRSVMLAAGPKSPRRVGNHYFVEAYVLEIRHRRSSFARTA